MFFNKESGYRSQVNNMLLQSGGRVFPCGKPQLERGRITLSTVHSGEETTVRHLILTLHSETLQIHCMVGRNPCMVCVVLFCFSKTQHTQWYFPHTDESLHLWATRQNSPVFGTLHACMPMKNELQINIFSMRAALPDQSECMYVHSTSVFCQDWGGF